MILKIELFL